MGFGKKFRPSLGKGVNENIFCNRQFKGSNINIVWIRAVGKLASPACAQFPDFCTPGPGFGQNFFW